jgi:hypothetical protein
MQINIDKLIRPLITFAAVAAVSSFSIFYLKKIGFLGTSNAVAKGFYHLFNLDTQGLIFALSIIGFVWLIARYAVYLATWLVIFLFYSPQILKFFAMFGVH